MTLGLAQKQSNLFDDVEQFCEEVLSERSIYSFLHRERDRLFPDEVFSDLFTSTGRRSVPPSVVAVVMVLQRLEGLSDREAVERYCFDNRWRYAAGTGSYSTGGWTSFAHTVLVDMRMRLRNSERPNRIFEAVLDTAKGVGLIGCKRVLDSTPLYDAVATMDTVTLIRSAIRGLLKVADVCLNSELRNVLTSGDDYMNLAKPQIDWDDTTAQEQLVDSRAKDAYACLILLEGRKLEPAVIQATHLLAAVVGQDLDEGDDKVLRIARRVAKDRIISTVDPQARHGHKSSAHGFDGYKGHIAIDPESEIITATVVTPGNASDGSVATELICDLLEERTLNPGPKSETSEPTTEQPTVYGDCAYGTGEFQSHLNDAGIDSKCKTQPPSIKNELFTKDSFIIDLDANTVTCPNKVTVVIRRNRDGEGIAKFARNCTECPLAKECTTSVIGRKIRVGLNEASLAKARKEQKDPSWRADYKKTRPKVERKIAHLMRQRHGGRRSRVRGKEKVGADFNLLAAATNLSRLATLGLHFAKAQWVVPKMC